MLLAPERQCDGVSAAIDAVLALVAARVMREHCAGAAACAIGEPLCRTRTWTAVSVEKRREACWEGFRRERYEVTHFLPQKLCPSSPVAHSRSAVESHHPHCPQPRDAHRLAHMKARELRPHFDDGGLERKREYDAAAQTRREDFGAFGAVIGHARLVGQRSTTFDGTHDEAKLRARPSNSPASPNFTAGFIVRPRRFSTGAGCGLARLCV